MSATTSCTREEICIVAVVICKCVSGMAVDAFLPLTDRCRARDMSDDVLVWLERYDDYAGLLSQGAHVVGLGVDVWQRGLYTGSSAAIDIRCFGNH